MIPIEEVLRGDSVIGYKADSFIYILSSKIKADPYRVFCRKLLPRMINNTIVAMTEKYRSTIYRLKDKALTQIAYNENLKTFFLYLIRPKI